MYWLQAIGVSMIAMTARRIFVTMSGFMLRRPARQLHWPDGARRMIGDSFEWLIRFSNDLVIVAVRTNPEPDDLRTVNPTEYPISEAHAGRVDVILFVDFLEV
jgi:hypothetical protein